MRAYSTILAWKIQRRRVVHYKAGQPLPIVSRAWLKTDSWTGLRAFGVWVDMPQLKVLLRPANTNNHSIFFVIALPHRATCAVRWVMIMGLRFGQIKGDCVDDMLLLCPITIKGRPFGRKETSQLSRRSRRIETTLYTKKPSTIIDTILKWYTISAKRAIEMPFT